MFSIDQTSECGITKCNITLFVFGQHEVHPLGLFEALAEFHSDEKFVKRVKHRCHGMLDMQTTIHL